MNEDWITRPLDILVGYEPGMKLPGPPRNKFERSWQPEDGFCRRPDEFSHWFWVFNKDFKHRWYLDLERIVRCEVNAKLIARAAERVKRLIEKGALTLDADNNQDLIRQEKALTYAVAILDDPDASRKDGLNAARLLLDFTKSKPVQKQDVTVRRAEDFLSELDD